MLWEENLNQKKKKMKNEELDSINTTNGIKNVSIKETWIIIGGEKKWIRKCPNCNKLLIYSHQSGWYRANKRNCRCSHCDKIRRYSTTNISDKISKSLKGRIFSKEHKEKLSLRTKGKNNPMYGKIGKLNPFYGKRHSLETKEKIGKLSTKINTGRKHSAETIKLWRKIAINRKKKLGIFDDHPYYNPIACKLIDDYGKRNGYNFQHALNGGEIELKELGYWVDGYDKNKNTIFEYNEPHHYDINGNLKEKDKRRLNEIKTHLQCKLIIYNSFNKCIEIL